nr:zinc finger, CCHC-type [Tanacetum cinerariifolium]
MAEEDALLAFQHECDNVKTSKELWDTLEAKYMAEDALSKKFLVSNFTNYKMTDSRPVLEQYNELLGILGRFTQHKMNMDESIQEDLTLIELGSHLRIKESLRAQDNDKPKGNNVAGPSVVNMWVDSGATVHVCKDKCQFKANESLNDGSILHMGNESTALVHGRGCVDLSVLNNCGHKQVIESNKFILSKQGHVHFKRMQDMSNDGLIPAFDMDTKKLIRVIYMDEALDEFNVFKTEVELQQGPLIKKFRIDRGGLSQGFWGEVMLIACYLLNMVLNKRNKITPYELWTKKKPNLNYLRVWGCRAVVRLLNPKLKTLGERGIECIFVGYAEHFKAFRFFVIEPNESLAINSIIESGDTIFDENRFSSVSRPSQRSLVNETEDSGGSVVHEKVTDKVFQQPEPELRNSKRHRTPKDFEPEFQLYLIEGTKDEEDKVYRAKYSNNNHQYLIGKDPNTAPLQFRAAIALSAYFKHTLKHLKVDLTLIELGSHLRIKESLRAHDNDKPKGNNVAGPSVVNMWVDSGATVHVCKDKCQFKANESLNDGSILHMGNESTALVHGRGCVDLRFSFGKVVSLLNVLHVLNIRKNLVSRSVLNNCGHKQVIESNKFILSKQGHVYFKRMQDMSQDGLIPAFDMDTKKWLSQGFWGEVMLTACYLLNRVLNKRNKITPYELWTKKKPNLNYLRVWGCRAVVRLLDPKLKTLGERGIECIFVGYAEHFKAFRFFVIEPNESLAINSIIESGDAIFDENRFSSVSRPSQRSLVNETKDSGGSVVPKKVTDKVFQQPEPELRNSKRHRTPKDFEPEFQLYLIEGTNDEVSDRYSCCFNVKDVPKTFDEAMKSYD